MDMKPRGLAMAVALLLAVGATSAIFLYVQGVKREAKPAASNVTVIVSKKNITAGTKLDTLIQEGAFTTVSVPRDALVNGAVSTLADLQGKTAAAFILQGEQITSARFQGSSQSTGGLLGIQGGYQAVTLPRASARGQRFHPGRRPRRPLCDAGQRGRNVPHCDPGSRRSRAQGQWVFRCCRGSGSHRE